MRDIRLVIFIEADDNAILKDIGFFTINDFPYRVQKDDCLYIEQLLEEDTYKKFTAAQKHEIEENVLKVNYVAWSKDDKGVFLSVYCVIAT